MKKYILATGLALGAVALDTTEAQAQEEVGRAHNTVPDTAKTLHGKYMAVIEALPDHKEDHKQYKNTCDEACIQKHYDFVTGKTTVIRNIDGSITGIGGRVQIPEE